MSNRYQAKGKDLLSKLGRTLKHGAETLVQETKELTRVGKIKMELLSLENEREKKFEEIGRLAHTLYKEKANFDRLEDFFAAIDEIEKEIDAKNMEIERARGSEQETGKDSDERALETEPQPRWCSQCGAQVGPDDKYCSQCGNSLNS